MPESTEIHVFEGPGALMDGAASFLADFVARTPHTKRLVLAGGSTPRGLYERLAEKRVTWQRHWFTFGDERCVPPGHAESNFGMAKTTLLGPLAIPGGNVVRLEGEASPEHAAAKADRALYAWSGRVPLFDVVILGLGTDGHVASLFPADTWPDFGARLVAATHHPDGSDRLTLTPAALACTALTVFLVSGEAKSKAVDETLNAAAPTTLLPATMVTGGGGRRVWLLDRAAAGEERRNLAPPDAVVES